MFMVTSEDDTKTEIRLSLMENNVLKGDKNNTTTGTVDFTTPVNRDRFAIKIIPVSFKTEKTFINRKDIEHPATDPQAFGIGVYHPSRLPRNNYNVSQLFQAIYDGRVEDVRFCLRYIDVHSREKNGRTPLIAAMFTPYPIKRFKLLQLCIECGVNLRTCDWEFHRSAFAWGCYLGRTKELNLLFDALDGDVNYNERDIHGNTHLHLAVLSNNVDTVRLLVDDMEKFNVNLDPTNNTGLTPYILARKMGLKEISNILSQKKTLSREKADDLAFRLPREWSILGQVERSAFHLQPIKRSRLLQRGANISQTPLTGLNTLTEEIAESVIITNHDPSQAVQSLPHLLISEQNFRNFKQVNESKDSSRWIHNAFLVWSEQNNPQYRKPAIPKTKEPTRKEAKQIIKSKPKNPKKKNPTQIQTVT